MSKSDNLFTKFKEILAQNPEEQVESGNSEVAYLLHKTDWVRIFVTYQIDNPTTKTIDVEVSIPSPASSKETSTSIEKTSIDVRILMERLVEHIKYFLELETQGFSIDFIENGCLLLASLSFDEIRDPAIFRFLLPPSA